mgnify:CR=1 FL=1
MRKFSKKQGLNHARKNAVRNGDGNKLDNIQQHYLQQLHKYSLVREPILENSSFSTRNCIRNPDFKVTFGNFICYLELDSYHVHGTYDEPNERTMIRNSDYERTKTNYIPLSESDAKRHNLDIADLSQFLISYEHTKQIAREYPN